jgi:hypothetical protein
VRSRVIDPPIKPVVETTTADIQPMQISECIGGDFVNPFGREMLRRGQIPARDRVHQQSVSLSFMRLGENLRASDAGCPKPLPAINMPTRRAAPSWS